MKFFYSPMTLIDLYKNRHKIAEELSGEHPIGWYLSRSGEQAYRNAKTFAQKVNYFYEYLRSLANTSVGMERIYKVAFIMAAVVDGSTLPYATYPDILNQDKNPLVRHTVDERHVTDEKDYGIGLLAKVFGLKHGYALEDEKDNPYELLTFVGEDGKVSDVYRLERCIIAAFGLKAPYGFDELFEGGTVEDDDDDENTYDDDDEDEDDYDEDEEDEEDEE